MNNFYEWLWGESGVLLRAGVAGSAVSVVMEWNGWNSAIRKFIIGAISSYYLSPLAIPLISHVLGFISVPDRNAPSLSGFIMGVVGVIVIESFLNAFRMWSKNPRQYREVLVPTDPNEPIKEVTPAAPKSTSE